MAPVAVHQAEAIAEKHDSFFGPTGTGGAVARAAIELLGGTYGRRVVVVAGKGVDIDTLKARLDAHAGQFPPPDGKPNLFALAADTTAEQMLSGLATVAAIVMEQRNGTASIVSFFAKRARGAMA